ncbi:MAG: mandelate racemase [Actinobacteria bacterium]|jgi:cis-L-3-hydroxyproline dehydratase|nr:mandelate racemase [Actinomycetota bacterium]
MRITEMHVHSVELPYNGDVYRLSGGRDYTSFDATIVEVVADNGLSGWGESTPFGPTYVAAHAEGVRAAIGVIAPVLIGEDPRLVDSINDRMDAALVGHRSAKAAIDVACWDLLGKATGMRVCELLGRDTRERMPLISSIYSGDPDDMRARVANHRERGYRGHSVKVGTLDGDGGPQLDADRVCAALADAQQGEYFIVDANGGMTVELALRFLKLVPDGLDFVFEAPCATWQEHLRLRQLTDRPLVLDELADSDVAAIQAVASGAADAISLKVSKNGGLTQCRRQRDIALAAGMTMSVQDTVGSDLSFAAVVHLGQSVPARELRCILDVRDMVTKRVGNMDVTLRHGGVLAPAGPGLGIEIDRAAVGPRLASYN